MEFRTIETFYNELIIDDPNTAITKRAIRRAVTNGDIPSRRTGSKGKYVFDKKKALAYFAGEDI